MQSIPVQSWNFEHESVVRIGRSTDNHVILYSAVVSRHHVEIRKVDNGWEIVNLGANGTYLDGKRITQVPVEDGVVIRLARSGPNVQIHLGNRPVEPSNSLMGEKTVGQMDQKIANAIGLTDIPNEEPVTADAIETAIPAGEDAQPARRGFVYETMMQPEKEVAANAPPRQLVPSACCHQYATSDLLFCPECGKPLRPIGVAGDYQLVQALEPDEVSAAFLAWKDGQTFILKTPLTAWMGHPEAVELFHQEARQFLTLDHPALPKFLEVFLEQGQPYLVMEPFYGRSLDQIVATEGVLSLSSALERLQDVCEVLNYLHHQVPPVLHQRLMPSHLIQRFDPSVPLLVAGLTPGRAIAPLQVQAEYAAPEQQQGQSSVASDLYALGPILAYLVTGQPPATFYAQREQGFRFYAEYVPGLTADIVAIVRKLTNPQPGERFSSAKDVLAALNQ